MLWCDCKHRKESLIKKKIPKDKKGKTLFIGILFPNVFWPSGEKIVLVIEKKLLKFEDEGQEFAKNLRSVE